MASLVTTTVTGTLTTTDDIILTGTRAIKNTTSAGILTIQGGQSWPGGKIILGGGNAAGGDIKFYTGLSTATPTERIVIKDGGNVGIGTTDPGSFLNLYSSEQRQFHWYAGTSPSGNNYVSTIGLGRDKGAASMFEIKYDSEGSEHAYISRLYTNAVLHFDKAGTDHMTIIADGNVGIGDDTPENKLTVNGSSRFKDTMFFATTNRGLISWGSMGGGTGFGMQAASGNGLSLGANATWDHIVILTDGKVGIGTNDPAVNLEVSGTNPAFDLAQAGTSIFRTELDGANDVYQTVYGAGNQWILRTNGGTAALTINASQNATFGGKVYATEYDLPSGGVLDWANGDARITEGLSSNYSLSLQTYDGSSAMVTNIFLASGGSVGIGTTNPSELLHVDGAGYFEGGGARDGGWHRGIEITTENANYASLYFGGQVVGKYSGIIWTSSTSGNSGNKRGAQVYAAPSSATNTDLGFATNNAVGTSQPTVKMMILGSGSVGIGTDAPAKLLELYSTSHVEMILNTTSNTSNCGIDFDLSGTRKGIIRYDHNATDASAKFEFYAGGDTSTPKMVLNGDGEVGIGTNDPTQQLMVWEGSSSVSFGEWTNGAVIWLDGVNGDISGGDYYHILADGSTALRFGYGATHKVSMLGANGYVGIGTTTPAARLHVDGTVRVGVDAAGHDVMIYGATTSRYWEWDASDDLVRQRDGVKTTFGNGTDLMIWHDGSNSYVQQGSNAGNLNFTNSGGTKFSAIMKHAGAVELYYDGTKKFETTSSGVEATLYGFDKSGSSIGGYLELTNQAGDASSNDVTVTAAHSTNSVVLRAAQKVEFYTYASSAYQNRMVILNDGKVGIGTTNPTNNLVVYATGHQVNFVTETDDHSGMRVKGADAKDKYILFNDQCKMGYQHSTATLHFCRSGAFGDNHLVINSSGSVGIGIGSPSQKLHVNVGKIAVSDGYNIGSVDGETGMYVDQDTDIRWQVGGSHLMTLASGGQLSVIDNAASATVYANFGPTTIDGTTREGGLQIHASSGSADKTWGIFVDANPNSFNINYLGARATAISGGTNVLSISNTGGVGIGMTPDGVLALKSSGDGVNVLNLADSSSDALFNVRQSGNDCLIRAYKDGGVQKVQIHTDGESYFDGGSVGIGTTDPGAALDVAKASGTILRCKGDSFNTRFAVGASGACTIEANTGNYALDIINDDSGKKGIRLADSVKTVWGNGDDLEIYHDGSHSYIKGTTTGDLYVTSENDDVVIRGADDVFIYTQGGEDAIIARGNAGVDIFHDNIKKFETTGAGVTITGTATATTFSGSGASLTSLNASNLGSGTVPTARLGSGTASSSTYLRGDNTWATVSGGGGDTVSITTSADDILSVSSGAISGVDAGSSDKIVFWDNSASKLTYLGTSTGISISGTSLSVGSTVCTAFSKNDPSGTYINPSANYITFAEGTGITLGFSGSTITFSTGTSSDYRLKKNISTFNSEAWTKVKSVNLRKFDFDEDAVKVAINSPDKEIHEEPKHGYTDNVGFIAHELAEAEIKGAVIGDKDAVDEDGNFIYQKVNYIALVPVLWGALKEAMSKIEILESKVQALEDK